MRQFLGAALLSLVAVNSILTQDRIETKQKDEAVEIRLHDGTILRDVTLIQDVDILTKDGRLTTPARDIRRIEFALRTSKETAAQIAAELKRLGHTSFIERTLASKKLAALGYRAYPALQASTKSSDPEVARRAAVAMEAIREAVAPELLSFVSQDVILVKDRELTGHIQGAALKVSSRTLGDLSLPLAVIRAVNHNTDGLVVAGATFDEPMRWHDTGILVERDTGFIIRASGEIVHRHSLGLQLVTGPDGRFPTSVWADERTTSADRHFPGTLVGKIGDEKGHFIVGSKFAGRSNAKGRLWLWIVPWRDADLAPTGSCRVEVVVNAKTDVKQLAHDQDAERNLRPFHTKQRKLVDEVIGWTNQMKGPGFNPDHRVHYEAAIGLNRKQIDQLNQTIRQDFGHLLYGPTWLERTPRVLVRF